MGKAGQLESEQSEENSLLDEFGMEKGESAIDSTLDEIQSLRIINDELEKEKREVSKPKDEINESEIEAQTMSKIPKGGNKFDKIHKIESLVQEQIEDQINAIEDSKTLETGYEILEYGNDLENKDETKNNE